MRPETQAAIAAATTAQRIADSRDGADQIGSKGGIDLVTGTDLACEDAIRAKLLEAFPSYPVIGEERGGTPRPGEPYWLVDPICGTRLFASDIPLYCTNLALVENGAVTMAVVGVGKTGEVLFAERGAGARLRTPSGDQRIVAGDRSNAIWIDGKADETPDVVHRAIQLRRWYVWMFSSTVSYAYLAMGRISGIIHLGKPSPTKHGSVHTAAGSFLSQEAGALVTDLATGGPWTLETRKYLVAASRDLHDELFRMVSETFHHRGTENSEKQSP